MSQTTIRPATLDDLNMLMGIAVAMHRESPRFSKLSFSHAKVQQLFATLVNAPSGLLLVAERDSMLTGAVAAVICPHWFSDELVATEYGVFILPEHRGGMAAARLVRAYVGWAKEQGARLIQCGISTDVHHEETAALYQALGLKQFSIGFEV